MRVTLLGTGSAMPSPTRVQSGVLVDAGGEDVLVDCGSGVVHRLAQTGRSHRDVDTVLLTHHHLDHVADLPTLLKTRVLDEVPRLDVIGPAGTRAVCDRLFAHDELGERGDVRVRELDPDDGPARIAGHDVNMAPSAHVESGLAYRFGDGLTLSGDTAPSSAVFGLADGSHTLVHECSFPDDVTAETHTTPAELVEGLDGIDVQRVVVTHLFPRMEATAEELGARLVDAVEAEIHVGTDRMQLGIPD